MNQVAVKETLKTVARGVWFMFLGLVALLLTVVATSPDVAKATITLPILNMVVAVGPLIVAGAAAVAKIIDRYIHKSDSKSNGLAPAFLQK